MNNLNLTNEKIKNINLNNDYIDDVMNWFNNNIELNKKYSCSSLDLHKYFTEKTNINISYKKFLTIIYTRYNLKTNRITINKKKITIIKGIKLLGV